MKRFHDCTCHSRPEFDPDLAPVRENVFPVIFVKGAAELFAEVAGSEPFVEASVTALFEGGV